MKKSTGLRVLVLSSLFATVLPVSMTAQGGDISLGYRGPLAVYHYVTDNWATLSTTTALSGEDSVIKNLLEMAGSLEGDLTKIDSEIELTYLIEKASLTPNMTIITPDKTIGRVIEAYFEPLIDEKDVFYDLCLVFQMRKVGLMFSSLPTRDKDMVSCDLALKRLIKNEGLDPVAVESRYKTAVAAEVDRVVSEEFAKVWFMTSDKKYNVILTLKGSGYEVSYNGFDASGTYRTYTVSSLTEMSKYGFTAKQIEDCRINAGNIPVVVYSNPAYPQDERNPMKVVARLIKDFLIAPDETKLNTIASLSIMYFRYRKDHPVYTTANSAMESALLALSPMLGRSIGQRVDAMFSSKIPVAFLPPTSPKDLAWFMFPIASGNGGILFRVPTADGWLR
jgi:hypothetical protein